MNIHFICRGNVLRSLIAETYFKSLNLKNIDVISSGTNVNREDPLENEYFANTLRVLDRHGIKRFAKNAPEQLTQQRIDASHDIIVLMNQRVANEASRIVRLPKNTRNWNIVDIGEDGTSLISEKVIELNKPIVSCMRKKYTLRLRKKSMS